MYAACCLYGLPEGTLETALSSGHSCLASGRPLSGLQTGTRGALGRPSGTVARVHVGEVIMPIHTKLQSEERVVGALCRAKFGFPGRRDVCISKEWGFTRCNADESEAVAAERWLIPDGSGVKYIPNRGPWTEALMRPWPCPFLTEAHQ